MSLHKLLTRLIWLCVGPLILLAVYLAALSVLDKQADRNIEASNLAKNFATAIDQHLQARISALHMLADSPLVDDPARWKDFYQEAQGFYQGFGSHVILADPQMHMLVNTRVPFGSKLPRLPPSKGQAAAPTALKTGKPAVGDIVFGPVAKEPLVAIAVPALRKGEVAFLLLTTFEIRQFQERLEQVALPAGWSLTLLDGNHEPIARRAPLSLNPEKDVDASGRFLTKSALSAWSVVLEVPRRIYREPLIEAAVASGIIILCAAFLSILGGIRVSRRLGKAVASLAEHPLPNAAPPDIAEIAAVRRLLDESSGNQAQAYAKLQETEERYRSFFIHSIDAVLLTAPDGRIMQANPEACRIFGRTEEEICNLGRGGLVDVSDPRLGPALEERQRTGRFKGELTMLRKDRSPFPAEISTAVFTDRDGSDRTSMIIRDITARKRADEALRESESRQKLFIEHAPASLAMFDREMRYLAVSRRWLDDYFLGDRDLYGLCHYDVFPEIGEDWKAIHRRAMAGEVVRSEEDRFVRADGRVQWLRWEVRPWHAADGTVGGIVVFSEDITARKKAEESILQLNNRLQYLIEVIQQLTCAASLEEIAAAVRTAARKLVGADGATFVLRDNDQCFYMDEDAIAPLWKGGRFPLERCISGWAMLHQEIVVIEDIYQDDRIPHDLYRQTFVKSVVITPIHLEAPYGAIGIYWARNNRPNEGELLLIRTLADATAIAMENVRAYQELETRVRERTRELAEANIRLQELDRLKSLFIASMSHELRTPLNSIIGFTGIILMGMSGEISAVQKKQLTMVKNSANHLLELINDVIDVSKIEAGKTDLSIESFYLAELALEVKETFDVAASDKGLELSLHSEEHLKVTSDRRRVRQILVNLVGNAVKFTVQGAVAVTVERKEAGIQVRVRDTGAGMRQEDMERLFQPFSRIYIQGRPVVEGTGLGLYLSQRIAALLGGKIAAESEYGRGSTFTFSLPLQHPEAQP